MKVSLNRSHHLRLVLVLDPKNQGVARPPPKALRVTAAESRLQQTSSPVEEHCRPGKLSNSKTFAARRLPGLLFAHPACTRTSPPGSSIGASRTGVCGKPKLTRSRFRLHHLHLPWPRVEAIRRNHLHRARPRDRFQHALRARTTEPGTGGSQNQGLACILAAAPRRIAGNRIPSSVASRCVTLPGGPHRARGRKTRREGSARDHHHLDLRFWFSCDRFPLVLVPLLRHPPEGLLHARFVRFSYRSTSRHDH
mmetsp:Transcript_9645/g.23716  ORF Transcript_9645/g.23716 Transcript_9645/m.23716 type:complete len:252 (-) Transcript_9645:562-1317(-)